MLVSREIKEQKIIERLIKKSLSREEAKRISWGGDGKLRYICSCGYVNVMVKLSPTRYETDKWLRKSRCPVCGVFLLSKDTEDLTKYFAKYKPRKKICKQFVNLV